MLRELDRTDRFSREKQSTLTPYQIGVCDVVGDILFATDIPVELLAQTDKIGELNLQPTRRNLGSNVVTIIERAAGNIAGISHDPEFWERTSEDESEVFTIRPVLEAIDTAIIKTNVPDEIKRTDYHRYLIRKQPTQASLRMIVNHVSVVTGWPNDVFIYEDEEGYILFNNAFTEECPDFCDQISQLAQQIATTDEPVIDIIAEANNAVGVLDQTIANNPHPQIKDLVKDTKHYQQIHASKRSRPWKEKGVGPNSHRGRNKQVHKLPGINRKLRRQLNRAN